MKNILVSLIMLAMAALPAFADDVGGRDAGNTDMEFPFWMKTNMTKAAMAFNAQGVWYIDWGDGSDISVVDLSDYGLIPIDHIYSDGVAEHTIRIGGMATGYDIDDKAGNAAVLYLYNSHMVTELGGCLGCIFPTLGDGSQPGQQPRFYRSFNGQKLTRPVPAGFLKGVHGQPTNAMFYQMFHKSTLPEIPADLFADLDGTPTTDLFNDTFSHNPDLKGTIPPDLFRGIRGAPAQGMFSGTFSVAPGITGTVSADLFAGIKGAPVDRMFQWTFYQTGLTQIEDGLLDGIVGANVSNAFTDMFTGGTPISCLPDGLFDGITGIVLSKIFAPVPNSCSCPTRCGVGYELGDCECVELPECDAGFRYLKSEGGLSFKLYAQPCTSPSLNIEYGDKVCSACLVQGAENASINLDIEGVVYHVMGN